MSIAPLWAAWSGIALTIFMAGVVAGYMIARAATERREYDAQIDGYQTKSAQQHRPRPPLRPFPPEREAPKSTAPAYGIGQIQTAWPRPSRLIIIPGRSQRSRYPLEDTGRILLGTDAEELRELEIVATANREAMRADNAAWLEAWSKAAP